VKDADSALDLGGRYRAHFSAARLPFQVEPFCVMLVRLARDFPRQAFVTTATSTFRSG